MKNNNLKQKLLFISATHGDEGFSIPILDSLEKRYPKADYCYDRIIGNPRALEKQIRFMEKNLNRSAPGDKNGKFYEERRAFKLLKKARDFDYVIDLHGAPSKCGIVIIICKPSLANFTLAGMLDIKKIVIWSTNEDYKSGPITQFCKTGLEIECGEKTDLKIQRKLKTILEKFIKNYQQIRTEEIIENLQKKQIYAVYDKQETFGQELEDFKKVVSGTEEFFPFMSNTYPELACYKLRKIKFEELFLEQSEI